MIIKSYLPKYYRESASSADETRLLDHLITPERKFQTNSQFMVNEAYLTIDNAAGASWSENFLKS